MNDFEKQYKKLSEEFTVEEIAEGYMIPALLSAEEKEASEAEIRKIRFERLNSRTELQRLLAETTRLSIKINHYLKGEVFLQDFSFGSILNQYISILQKSKKDFAKDLDVHHTRLSRIINDREDPNIGIMYRLEKHSAGIIPALYWWKLYARKREDEIQTNQLARAIESEKVRNNLKFSA